MAPFGKSGGCRSFTEPSLSTPLYNSNNLSYGLNGRDKETGNILKNQMNIGEKNTLTFPGDRKMMIEADLQTPQESYIKLLGC